MDSIREQILSSMHDAYRFKTASKLQDIREELACDVWKYFKENMEERRNPRLLHEMVVEQISDS